MTFLNKNNNQEQVNDNLEDLFDLSERVDPVEQGKVWGELSDKQLDNTDDLLLNKLTVELIINSKQNE